MPRLKFKVEAEAPGTRARAASFTTLHGMVKTPVFMPVGTQATVKSQTVDALKTAGSSVLLANTYHLLLRPGPEVFRKFGGIHRFMNWDGPVLTDSGGFQIFSLPHSLSMDEAGARFKSYVDGRTHLLSPESSIDMQKAIGSDIMMVLDQCIPSTAEHTQARTAMDLTHRWAKRSLAARGDSPQSMFGIVQGACFQDLRRESASFLTELPFDGFAIGGLAVGETKAEREDFTEWTASLLPRDLPRYLMGVGTPLDILEAVHRGVDMFDCIIPSALSQRGVAFTSLGKLQLRRSVYKFAEERLDPQCDCLACTHYSRAYLHHLNKADEVLGWKLLSTHNITSYHRLMREMREAIFEGTFLAYYRVRREELARADEAYPVGAPKKPRTRLRHRTELGDYEIHTSVAGFSSIRQKSSGEIMHSVSEPSEEADRLYIRQLGLEERLREVGAGPLVVWDVGLGAATNAMAAIRCFEGARVLEGARVREGAALRPLHIVSFERDLDPLRLAARHPTLFPHLRHAAPSSLLEHGRWTDPTGLLTWELLEGDFLERSASAPLPALIFYDPFSPKTDSPLWTVETFERLRERCGGVVGGGATGAGVLGTGGAGSGGSSPGALGFGASSFGASGPGTSPHQVELATYSSSTAVRAALLAAGFFVARGVPTGDRAETTRAFLRRPATPLLATPLLGMEWLERWGRSQAKYPADLAADRRAEFEARVLAHPQFGAESGI